MALFTNILRGAIGNAAKSKSRNTGLLGLGMGLIATRIATRSLPGAAIIGGAMLAKAVYDRRRGDAE